LGGGLFLGSELLVFGFAGIMELMIFGGHFVLGVCFVQMGEFRVCGDEVAQIEGGTKDVGPQERREDRSMTSREHHQSQHAHAKSRARGYRKQRGKDERMNKPDSFRRPNIKKRTDLIRIPIIPHILRVPQLPGKIRHALIDVDKLHELRVEMRVAEGPVRH
jgi:hypothetical protein